MRSPEFSGRGMVRSLDSFNGLDTSPRQSLGSRSPVTKVRSMTIFVGNLSYRATEDDLRDVFQDYGEVKRIVMPTDRETGRMRGFAFVDLSDETNEDTAISSLDGKEHMGRSMRVNKAKPREDRRQASKKSFI